MQARPWLNTPASGEHIATMMTREELQLLRYITEHEVSGPGGVLEIGPWLGASTYALAAGLVRNPRATDAVVTSVDSFVWHGFMGSRSILDIADGDSFEPAFLEHMLEFGDRVRAVRARLPDDVIHGDALYRSIREHTGDTVPTFAWDGAPLSVLFVDGAKSWCGLQNLYAQCLPCMAPGSWLVLQDYRYWGCYWVAILSEWIGDALEIAHVPEHNTVSFRVRAPISADRARDLPTLFDVDVADAHAAARTAAARLRAHGDPRGAALVDLSAIRFLWHRDAREEAHRVFLAVEARWPSGMPRDQLEQARSWLTTVSGVRHAPSLRLRGRVAARRVVSRVKQVLR